MYIIDNKYLVRLDEEKYVDIFDIQNNRNVNHNLTNNYYDRWMEIILAKTQIISLNIPNTEKNIRKLYKIFNNYLISGRKKKGIIKLKKYNLQILYYFNNKKYDVHGIWIKKLK